MATSILTPIPDERDILAALCRTVTDEGAEALRVTDIPPPGLSAGSFRRRRSTGDL